MLLHQNSLVKIVRDIELDRAALMGCAVTTGMGAVLNTAGVTAGSTVAVFGAGGSGLGEINELFEVLKTHEGARSIVTFQGT